MDSAAILSLFAAIQPDCSWSFAACKPSDTGKLSHGYHRYPAKFIPQLAERLLDEYLPHGKGLVNDPFVGSGTTMVAAILRGHRAVGTDVNEIAVLMSRVKCTPLPPDYLAERVSAFLSRLTAEASRSLPEKADWQSSICPPSIERIAHWFLPGTAFRLSLSLNMISGEDDPLIRDFLLLAFSNILKPCSLWSRSSTKPTRDLRKTPAEPLTALRGQLNKMQRGNAALWLIADEEFRREPQSRLNLTVADARSQSLSSGSADLVITSSPYVTSYEYADLHQLSALWLDCHTDLGAYRARFIGSRRRIGDVDGFLGPIAQQAVAQMGQKDARMAAEIATYFADMRQVIAESHRVLRDGGHACYVIGNTTLKGVDIPNAQAFAEIMLTLGFDLERIIKREIPSKTLPQTRDARTGRFASRGQADRQAYPTECIVVGRKPGA